MSDHINIRGNKDINDNNYRYKMSKLKIKIEGSGNGIKTVLVNINDIENELYKNKFEICKYLSIVCNTNYLKNVLNGEFTNSYLQNKIYNYIDSYVLCELCKLPETKYKISKKKLYNKCQACSHKYEITGNEKLNKYIIKNKMQMKINSKEKKKENIVISDNDDIIWYSDLSDDAVKKRREEFFN